MASKPYDVILLGSGIVAFSAAEYLSRHGVSTLVLEQFAFFHSQGSSHGDSRIFRLTYPDGFYAPLTKASSVEWENLEKRASLKPGSLLQRSGCLQFGGVTNPTWQNVKRVVKDWDIPHECLSSEEANKRFRQFRFPTKEDTREGEEIEIIFEPSSGTLMADKILATLATLARQNGAQLIDNHPVVRIVIIQGTNPQIVEVVCFDHQTNKEKKFYGKKVVLCSGSWSKDILENSIFLSKASNTESFSKIPIKSPAFTITQENVLYFPPKFASVVKKSGSSSSETGLSFQDFTGSEMPVWLFWGTKKRPMLAYGLPIIKVPGVKVALFSQDYIQSPSQRIGINLKNLNELSSFSSSFFPALTTLPSDILSCRFTYTPDEHPVIDRIPVSRYVQDEESRSKIDDSCLFMMAGWSGHGFKFGSILGEMVHEMVFDKKPARFDRSHFSWSRFDKVSKL